MAMAEKVQIPARKPAVVPQARSVLASARNMPRFAAITREKIAVKPKILPFFPAWICSVVKLLSIIQALPKSAFEYQRPPTIKAEMPATTIASQLMLEKFIVKYLSFNKNTEKRIKNQEPGVKIKEEK